MKTIFDVFQVSGPPMLRAGADLWVDLVPEEIILDPVAPARLGPNITLSCKVGENGGYFIWGCQAGKGRPVPTIEWKRDGTTYTGIGVDQGEPCLIEGLCIKRCP